MWPLYGVSSRYITRPSDSLVEALSQYESAYKLEENFAAFPNPTYAANSMEFETADGRKIYDLCFHLMKLYSRRSYPLESVLNPIAYTSNVLDYRLRYVNWYKAKMIGSVDRRNRFICRSFIVGSSWSLWKVSGSIIYQQKASIQYIRVLRHNLKSLVYGTTRCSFYCTFRISQRK